MNQAYKNKIGDLISSVEGRLNLIDLMIEGRKPANPAEARQFIKEAKAGIERISELISIS